MMQSKGIGAGFAENIRKLVIVFRHFWEVNGIVRGSCRASSKGHEVDTKIRRAREFGSMHKSSGIHKGNVRSGAGLCYWRSY
jgi:hypothetical protein